MLLKIYSILRSEPIDKFSANEEFRKQEYQSRFLQLKTAYPFFLFFTLIWLIIRLYNRFVLTYAPNDINYKSSNWIQEYFLKEPMSDPLWFFLFGVSVGSTLLLFKYSNQIFLRLVLLIALLLLNIPENGFGYIHHQNHLFLLAHLFLLFVDLDPQDENEIGLSGKSQIVFQAALLLTYSLAGLWKVKSILLYGSGNDGVMTWLHPDALPFRYLMKSRMNDLSTDWAAFIYDFRYFFLIGVLITIFVQLVAVISAFRRRLQLLVIPALIFFHLFAFFLMRIPFFTNIVVLVILFFPYDYLKSGKRKKATDLRDPLPFYNQRNLYWEKNPLFASFLYLPGIASLGRLWCKLKI